MVKKGTRMKEEVRKSACARLPAGSFLAERVGNALFHFFRHQLLMP
jgi:hypothetical protein